jgi:hypothetical protein
MGPNVISVIVAVLFLLAIFLGGGKLGPALRDLFRGGPRPPSHPLPANDSEILTRPRSRATP